VEIFTSLKELLPPILLLVASFGVGMLTGYIIFHVFPKGEYRHRLLSALHSGILMSCFILVATRLIEVGFYVGLWFPVGMLIACAIMYGKGITLGSDYIKEEL